MIHKDLKSHKLDDDIGEERLSIKSLENYWNKLKTEEEKTSRLIEDDILDDKNLSENQLIVSCDGIQNIWNINLKHNEEYSLTPSISHDVEIYYKFIYWHFILIRHYINLNFFQILRLI